jgi:Ni/Co efflux regulator RcnB
MFKKLIQATAAVAMLATPMVASVAEAQAQRTTTVTERPNGTTVRRTTVRRAPVRPAYRRWVRGQRFDRRYAPNYAVLDYRRYRARRLYAPPRGYRWVRSGNDAVLVGITTGLIAATIAGAIN